MSKPTDSSLFIVSSVPALYQRIFSGVASHEELGNRVLRQIKAAHTFRQVEQVRELAGLLVHSPIREFHLIGQYYFAWCKSREAEYHPNLLERIAEQTQTYKAQTLMSRAVLEMYQGEFEHALYFYTEALRTNPTVSDFIHISQGIASVKAMEGFNRAALIDLEKLLPLLRYAEPLPHFTTINSYAVELIEANRLTEAENVLLSIESSPLASYYPEWRETREDISGRRASRATVAFSAASVPETINLLHMPLRERSAPEPFTAQARAAVLDMQAWKNKKMTKDDRPPKPVTSEEKQARHKELEKLHGREILVQIMSALGDESVGDDSLRKALVVLEGLDEG